jgi:hypothetical protein
MVARNKRNNTKAAASDKDKLPYRADYRNDVCDGVHNQNLLFLLAYLSIIRLGSFGLGFYPNYKDVRERKKRRKDDGTE